jgi:GNAT superfamily N-acetyltransferase
MSSPALGIAPGPWPAHLPVAAVRFARPSGALEECRHFYEEVVGLDVLFEFTDHDGYDGVVLGLPDRSVQLELIRFRDRPAAAADPEDALVIYVEDVAALRERLTGHTDLLVPENPYWVRAGAFTIVDPDARHVLVVPAADLREPAPTVEVTPWTGDRRDLLWSFRLAEDSEAALAGYLDAGRVWVARGPGGAVLGHLQAVAAQDGASWEILNTAVAEAWQGRGIGRLLVERAAEEARAAGATRLTVATAAADLGNLRFYQRCGMRFSGVVRDRFVPETGYPDPIEIDGILLRDQVWFDRELAATDS